LRRDPAARSAAALRSGPTPDDWNLREAFLEATRRKYSVPGLVAAALIDGKLLAIGAAGVRQAGDTERVALTDRFHLGSCTKSMTATMIARLVEAGKLSWELALEEALPDLAPAFHRRYRTVTLC
jgi:CubicO group peptidase (beta-lactamase class C family)